MTTTRTSTRLATLVAAAVCAASCNLPAFGGCKVEAPDASIAVPDSFVVRFTTNRGPFDVTARKSWSPNGVARFYTLVEAKHYDQNRFFRVIKGFVAQFGLAGNPKDDAAWRTRCIADDPVKHQNARGTVSFARGRPNTRSTQLFVNLGDNTPLDALDGFGFAPIGEVTSGMNVVDSLYAGYGDSPPKSGTQFGREGPAQDSIVEQGNAYLARGWPKLDYIETARIVQEWPTK